MPDDNFELECDRLSSAVDSVQFERIRWARHEGPMLERMVQLAQAAVADRPDFELTDEGSRGAVKRYVIKVHGFRIVAVNLGLDEGRAAVRGETIERSRFRIAGQRYSADFALVDEAWMKATLGAIIGEIEAPAAD